jgi:hypothetical protein
LKFTQAIYILFLAIVLCPAAQAKIHRSHSATTAFKRGHPCPANDQRRGVCPGFVIDHIKPLCAGGADDPANMQWQTKADSLIKDIDERRQCRALRQALLR